MRDDREGAEECLRRGFPSAQRPGVLMGQLRAAVGLLRLSPATTASDDASRLRDTLELLVEGADHPELLAAREALSRV